MADTRVSDLPATPPAPPVKLEMLPVQSSMIASIGYDPATQTLGVLFARGGDLYRHYGVPPEVFAQLLGSPSVGRTYNELVRGKYQQPAPPAQEPAP